MILLTEFLDMSEEDREGKFPFIWAVDRKNQLTRVIVAKTIVESCEERRDFWILLRDLAGTKPEAAAEEDLESKIWAEIVGKIARKLAQLAGGNGVDLSSSMIQASPTEQPATTQEQAPTTQTESSAWIETDECTSCNECINLNPKIFAYNQDKKAYIKDAQAGPYQDLVLAAEKCTAQVIHPGLPADKTGKDIEKWIKRAEKYN